MSTLLSAAVRDALVATVRGRVRFDEPLRRHLSFKVGGPADAFVEPSDDADLLAAATFASTHALPLVILGGGTNLVASDLGVRGLVLNLEVGFSEARVERDVFGPGEHRLVVGGGLGTFRLLKLCKTERLEGMEYLAGVPGTMGGAVRMNAGTFAGEIVTNCESVTRLMWQPEVQLVTVPAAAMGFAYRHSNLGPRDIVVRAAFRVRTAANDAFAERIDDIIRRRKATQPVELPNAGSIFKNPPGDYAGRLIEAAGLKGTRRGGAEISPKHANFIVNVGDATAQDIVDLAESVRAVVRAQFGVDLEWEVKRVGEWPEVHAS